MDFIKSLASRKFLLTLAGTIIIFLKGIGILSIEDDNLWQLIASIAAFVGVEGAADIVGRWRNTNISE